MWTPGREQTLTDLWTDGLPPPEIADRLGVTQSSVVSKAFQLGLPRRNSAEWSDEKVAILKRMWADGDSASIIAAELKTTRNAVCGKIHRLGLEGRETRERADYKPRPSKPRQATVLAFRKPTEKPIEPEVFDSAIPLEQRRSLLQLTKHTCKWPVGHLGVPGFYFCGGKTSAGPYCQHHDRIAHHPPIARKDHWRARA